MTLYETIRTAADTDSATTTETAGGADLTVRRRLHIAAASSVVVGMHLLYRYEQHWWYDNLAHLLAGFAIGAALHEVTDDRRMMLEVFLGVAAGWEAFEYAIEERPWDGSKSFDGAMEDTVLDSIMGAAGVWIAAAFYSR